MKLDSWHALALPMFQAAFPDVPWIYLIRDPVEVLVSQSRRPGTQAVPGLLPEQLFRGGAEAQDAGPKEDATSRVLAAFHRAVLPMVEDQDCLIIDYSTLPEAVVQRIAPHFGILLKDEDAERMRLTAAHDAKSPGLAFVDDGASKQSEATGGIRAAAELHLSALHHNLVARGGGAAVGSG